MTTTERRRAAVAKIREAEEVVALLREGFTRAGVKLPSLRIDAASCAGDDPAVLIDLGRCNLEAAQRLSRMLDEKAAAS
ncbi:MULTISPECIES: hypothetical protein [unclassified Streptomyces]|uniref:hypothetical protein n=1 Tax=unclassified Streptomyces TaxID=2593676 RepID=UPI002ED4CCC9|nr:hypothetical protein OH827_18645 [Streptomyces sp. NBC_00891]WSY06900.1 hypothetical protein OG464_18645 [Streptomyces sp. NBC_00890]WSZ08526.1 hypothetical protein OG704_18645 [Streptomyces sp. NBC_00869]WSZ23975.1 hypothetical protein OG498_14920 [Streptomyces sp. NBC_00870]